MSWRASTTNDHDRIARLMLALYAEDPAPRPPGRDGCLMTLAELERHPLRGVAVVHEPERAGSEPARSEVAGAPDIDGYALLCSFWSNELGGEVCIIDELFVAPEARGQGAATELVQGLRERRWPWFRDAVAVELEVTPSNARARALYERLGFRPYENALMRALQSR